MPGIIVRNGQFGESGSGIDGKEIWSKQRDDVSREQLQKFWSELSPAMRRELLRIDKQTLFEQARKNLYCSRCNGLLLEGFSQIIMYAKSVQQENGGSNSICEMTNQRLEPDDCEEDGHDPSLHPWGGLVATREGLLTLMDCFLEGTSLDGVQSVFDSARAREHDREMLYPDACGGSGRGWISQGIFSYGRGHGMRETCALHTAKLSCDALVDFWSALGDDTRLSLLRMKEEDFIERLMYRFDSKRFCRDCRRNVIREFKELKELKRMKKELRCTTWFCGADTAFQYEVSDATIHVDWRHSFNEVVDTYHHFEWAVGTGEGKSDILAFEDVGMNGTAEVDGLELGGLGACFITLRAWRLDGRCTELTGKAHAMKGQPCVHRRLVVGDGFVTICSGDNIRRFFEHAEEAEEEEDDDSMDKDGSEIDGESSRPQKHAKSPELAREFLLDAATVIFKEQVEKAFREGTARQNAHSIFVCLTLKLLEERVLVACKEIITLEKQKKLLEEEEKEKHEEELRKERRRLKEREKKLRRKERIRGKEKETNKSSMDQNETVPLEAFEDSSTTDVQDDSQHYYNLLGPAWKEDVVEEVSHTLTDLSHVITKSSPPTSDVQCIEFEQQNFDTDAFDGLYENIEEYNDAFTVEQSKSSRRKVKLRKDTFSDSASQWSGKHEPAVENDNHDCRRISDARFHGLRGPSSRCPVGPRQSRWRTNNRSYASKLNCSCSKIDDRYSTGACLCNQYNTYRMKGTQSSADMRTSRGIKTFKQPDIIMDMSKPYYRGTKYSNGTFSSDGHAAPKWPKVFPVDHYGGRADVSHTKRIWAPMDARKRFSKGNSHLDDACPVYDDLNHGDMDARERNNSKEQPDSSKEPSAISPESDTRDGNVCDDKRQALKTNIDLCCPDTTLSSGNISDRLSGSCSYSSSPCPSEADSSSPRNTDSLSVSDSEDASPSEEREAHEYNSSTNSHGSPGTDHKVKPDTLLETDGRCAAVNSLESNSSTAEAAAMVNGNTDDVKYTAKTFLHSASNQGFPLHAYPSHATRCYPTTASWVASAANNGLSPFPQPADDFIIPNYPIGYTAQAHVSSPFYVPYGTLQPLSPLYSAASFPYLYPMKPNRSSNSKLKEQLNTAKLKSNLDGKASEVPERPIGPLKNIPSEASPVSKNGEVASDMDRSSFSFFHFGVPACSSLKEDGERVDVHSPVWPIASDQAKVDATRCKKEAGVEEEYSLFSASNRNRFAFF